MDHKFLQDGMSAMSAGATVITGWSLTILGATVAGIVAGHFVQPSISIRWIYLLFIPGWVFLGISIWYGDSVTRRLGAAGFTEDHARLSQIAGSMDSDYAAQRGWFYLALLTFGIWLAVFLLWWVLFAKVEPKSTS